MVDEVVSINMDMDIAAEEAVTIPVPQFVKQLGLLVHNKLDDEAGLDE